METRTSAINNDHAFALVHVDFRFLQKLGPDKQTLYITDTSIRRTLFRVRKVSVLERVDCN